MWAKHGSLSIVDLGNDYFTASFANNDDHYRALMEGPWLIYDHYLSVQEWKPNFCPSSDAVEQIAVWVRISGLPLEYYDARVLAFIGNRIGTTVKVDRNTLKIERGKYARLCMQVDLTKPLLAMFSIKGRHYKIENEGLHLLCLRCGRFGHVKDEYGVAAFLQGELVNVMKNGVREEVNTFNVVKEDGPWVVVQKTQRNRRPKHHDGKESGRITMETPNGIPEAELNDFKGGESSTGSRFNGLDVNIPTMEKIDAIDTDIEVIEEIEVNEGREKDTIAGNSNVLNLMGPRSKNKEKKRKLKEWLYRQHVASAKKAKK
ncbi:uncharacterized protein LOC131605159 [Vicia villosa]|uniref:uncharacterized protein LOC131605159 n=1 Tax=Vicia villosa TaxID=3911 RepID=UPI00273ABD32|nr:uncharacterized protein LOC131605159 [Vicia villosa]